MPSQNASPTKKLPIFVFPNRIDFIVDQAGAHKQVFTLHNPYDFPIKFKLLTTQRYRYKVMQREGQIKEKHCTDIIVKLHDNVIVEVEDETVEQRLNSKGNKYFSRDRLRFDVTDVSTERALGNKDVECFIWRTRVDFESHSGVANEMKPQLEQLHLDNIDDDSMMNSMNSNSTELRRLPTKNREHKYETRYAGSIWVPAVAIVICLVILSLKNETGETEASWLTSSENQRLIASYVLGILTMIIVQYQQ